MSGKKIAWFASWPDTEDKVRQITENSVLLKKNGWDVGLITQYPNLNSIDFSLLDHVVFDNTNEMHFSESKYFEFGFKRIIPSCSEMRQECGDITFVDNKMRAPHLYSVCRLYAISMHLSLGFDYKVYAYFESDFNGTQMLCDNLNLEADEIMMNELNFIGFDTYNQNGSVNACLFLGNPKILSHHFPIFSIKTPQDHYLHYQNQGVEDYLKRAFFNDNRSKIYPKEKVLDFLGEYGKDWDTSQAGLNWLDSISPRSLSSFTTNAPFLQAKKNGYSLFYLFKQELISKDVDFYAKVSLVSDQNDKTIFEERFTLPINHFRFYPEFFTVDLNGSGSIRVETTTTCDGITISENYQISLEFHELAGYYSIRHIE